MGLAVASRYVDDECGSRTASDPRRRWRDDRTSAGARSPEFARLLDAARRRRELLRVLAECREQQRKTQTAVAAAMQTSQSFVARLESAADDAKRSTIERFADALGYVVRTTSFRWTRAPMRPPS